MSTISNEKFEELRTAHTAKCDAEKKLDEAIKRLFPVGSPITWLRAGRTQTGTVAMHGYWDRILVVNDRTGASPWISTYDILGSAP